MDAQKNEHDEERTLTRKLEQLELSLELAFREQIAMDDLENKIPSLRSDIDYYMNHRYYETRFGLERYVWLLDKVERYLATVKRGLQVLRKGEDSFSLLEPLIELYDDIPLIISEIRESVSIVGEFILSQLDRFLNARENAAIQQAMADAVDVPVRELSLEETTLQSTEYTQKHIDEAKVNCSVCLEDYVLKQKLQQCPQCSQLFHEHCMVSHLKTRHSCPLCRYELERNVVDTDTNNGDNSNDDNSSNNHNNTKNDSFSNNSNN